jgi:uracil-DNA glycosylase family 4
MNGALCDRCVLAGCRVGGPVKPELHTNAQAAVIIDYPGETDIEQDRPLVGSAGMIFNQALDAIGVARPALSYHAAVACRPPNGNYKRAESMTRRANKKNPDTYLMPVDACRPRLMRELANTPNLILAGKLAYTGVAHLEPNAHVPSIEAVQGNITNLDCVDGVQRKAVPIIPPSRVLGQRKWVAPMRATLSRALRWFAGRLAWDEPLISYSPPVAWLEQALPKLVLKPWVACDTETDALEPWLTHLKTVQFAEPGWSVVLCLRKQDGSRWYADADHDRVVDLLKTYMPRMNLIGHNLGSYDHQVLQHNLKIEIRTVVDTVILHRYVDPDLPHTLAFVGSYYSDVHAWKADKAATTATTDYDLQRYGALDTVVNARVLDTLLRRARLQHDVVYTKTAIKMRPDPSLLPMATIDGVTPDLVKFDPVLMHDHNMQRVCNEMHQIGIRINQDRREYHEKRLTTLHAEMLGQVQSIMQESGVDLPCGFDRKGEPLFNPNSPADMGRLLFDTWDLPFPDYLPKKSQFTDSGEKSTGDALLRAYMCDMSLSAEQHAILHACRRTKKIGKLLGSYIVKLRPFCREVNPNDFLAVWPDGRLRVNWNVHGTGVGRLSCGGRPSRTNVQTIPSVIKDCYEPEPGHAFVGADLSAIHLVLIGVLWGIPSLIDDFTHGRDPHVTLARVINPAFDSLPGAPCEANNFEWQGAAKQDRNTAKSLRYAGAYGAAVPTIHAVMTRTEDANGNLTNRTLSVSAVQAYYERWMGAEPHWRRAWDTEISLFKAHGYMCTPILGRRADFPDMDRNAIINFRILATEGDIMGLSTVRVRNRCVPGSFGKNTGIVAQIHDQIVLEVPLEAAEQTKQMLVEEMSRTPRGWAIPIKTDGKIGDNLTFKHDPTKKAA